jgi:hypothetical protein
MNAQVNKDNTLAPLAPFLDKKGLIRLGGRTEAAHLNYNAKYPLLLHQKDPLTTTLARFIHLQLEHSGGPRAIIIKLNKRFWAPKSSMLFQKIAYGCIPCRKRLAKPTKQIMAPLPFYRMPSGRLHLFDYSAIDVAGPFQTKIGRSMVKRWLLVIRCSTTGAVHLEMIDYMDTSSFLLAIERFLALRPRPSVFIADNGSNFKGGDSALQGITEKGQKSTVTLQHQVSICTSQSSTFPRSRRKICWGSKVAIHSALHAHPLTDQ